MILNYPDNFTSSQTWQNDNYSFPHNNVLSLKYNELKLLLLSDEYIIPDYISYLSHDNPYQIINKLKLNEDFIILGVSFMKFKGLNEKWETLMQDSLEWKATHTHHKFQNLINNISNNMDYIYMINYITNILQIMIINILYHAIYYDFPSWMILPEFKFIINILKKIINLHMMEIPVSETIYIANIIPLLNELYDYMNDNVTFSNVTIKTT